MARSTTSAVPPPIAFDWDTLAHELLPRWGNDDFDNSIAIGTSAVAHAISYLKICIVDGVYTVRGSTNWSLAGESSRWQLQRRRKPRRLQRSHAVAARQGARQAANRNSNPFMPPATSRFRLNSVNG
jgi:hypothetical protein